MRKVSLNLLAADAVVTLNGIHKNTHDIGTGFVIDEMNETMGDDTLHLFKIAVINGRFDGHRNDLGELWVNDFEIQDIV